MSNPPRRDPRSEPGEVPHEERFGRRGLPVGSVSSKPPKGQGEPPSDTQVKAGVPGDDDLLAELAGQLLREERNRRAAEARVATLEEELRASDALRDRTITELRAHIEELRQELRTFERRHAEELVAARLASERELAEAAAEIASLRARRSPSVRAMAAATVASAQEDQRLMAQELEQVRRSADDAISALRALLSRKEAVLAEGLAILERLQPSLRPPSGRLVSGPRPSTMPTPAQGVEVGDYPELLIEQGSPEDDE